MLGALVAPTLVVALLPGLLSSKPAARQQVQSPVAQSPTLVTSYDACCELLLSEIQASQAGDEITLGIYLLEGGSSSNRVLSALEEAGRQRDVRVNFALDVSYVSMISRTKKTTSTAEEVPVRPPRPRMQHAYTPYSDAVLFAADVSRLDLESRNHAWRLADIGNNMQF